MAFQAITNGTYVVHPTKNDVASSTGDGSKIREDVVTDLHDTLAQGADWVHTGFNYDSDSGLTVTLQGGKAIVEGYYVSRTGTSTLTLAASATNYIYLTFALDVEDDVAQWGFEVNTTGTPPTAPYLPILEAVTDGSAVTGTTDTRNLTPPFDLSPKISTSAPTINDDTTAGYYKGRTWVNTTNNDAYVCVDDTDGAAVWLLTGTEDLNASIDSRLDSTQTIAGAWTFTSFPTFSAATSDAELLRLTRTDISRGLRMKTYEGTYGWTLELSNDLAAWSDVFSIDSNRQVYFHQDIDVATGISIAGTEIVTAGRALQNVTFPSTLITDKGSASGLATLDGDGKVPITQIPATAITATSVVADETAQLALTAQQGDVAVRTDESKSYIHNGGVAGTMADWTLLYTPTDLVLSVNGYTGAVSLTTSDITEGSNLYYTDARVDARLDTAQTIAGAWTYVANQVFANNTELRWIDSGSTQRTVLELDSSNIVNLGSSAGGGIIFRGDSYANVGSVSGAGAWNFQSGSVTTTGVVTAGGGVINGSLTISNIASHLIMKETDAADPLDFFMIGKNSARLRFDFYDNSGTSYTALASVTEGGTWDFEGNDLTDIGTVTATSFSGDGSALTAVDAATLDGVDSTQFLRSDASDSYTGAILTIVHTAPILRFLESDAATTHNIFEIGGGSGGHVNLNTRTSAGAFVSTDYQMKRDASGAYEHSWMIAGSVEMDLSSAGLDLNTNPLIGATTGTFSSNLTLNSSTYNDHLVFDRTGDAGVDNTYRITVAHANNVDALAILTAGTRTFHFTQDGRLGIGSSLTPDVITADLHVAGAGLVTGDLASGTLTVGSPSNVTTVDLQGSPAIIGDARYLVSVQDATTAAQGVGGGIGFLGKYSGSLLTTFAAIWGEKENATSSNYAGQLHLGTRVHGGNISSDLIIDSAGDITIAGAVSTGALTVTGDSTFSGNLIGGVGSHFAITHTGGSTKFADFTQFAGWDRRMIVTSSADGIGLDVTNIAASAGRNLLLNLTGGNVGVGIAAPTALLHVLGTGNETIAIATTGVSNAASVTFANATRSYQAGIRTDSTWGIFDDTTGLTRYVLDSSGNHDFKSGTVAIGGAVTMTNASGAYMNLVRTSNRFTVEADNTLMSLGSRDAGDVRIITDAGVEKTRWSASGVIIPAQVRLYLDGVGGSAGNTYIHESSADQIQFITGGTNRFGIFSGGAYVLQGSKMYLDGGSNTYITSATSDTMDLFTGGISAININSAQAVSLSGTLTVTGASTLGHTTISRSASGWAAEIYNTGTGATNSGLYISAGEDSGDNVLLLADRAGSSLVTFRAHGAMYFGSALDTNLYRSAADTLKTDDTLVVGSALYAGGANAPTNGTHNINGRATLKSDGSSSAGVWFESSTGTSTTFMGSGSVNDSEWGVYTNGNWRIALDSTSGYVHIGPGWPTPAYQLDVTGTFRATGAATLDSTLTVTGTSTYGNVLTFGTGANGGTVNWSTNDLLLRAKAGKGILLQPNVSTTAITLDSSGNTTINGTLTADSTLTVTGASTLNAPLTMAADATNGSQIFLRGTWGAVGATDTAGYMFSGFNVYTDGASNTIKVKNTHATGGYAYALYRGYSQGIEFHAATGSVTAGATASSKIVDVTPSGVTLYGATTATSTLTVTGATEINNSLTIDTGAPLVTLTPNSYSGNYATSLAVDSSARGYLTLGNNSWNQIRFGQTIAGGYGEIWVNNTAAPSTTSDGIKAMTFAASGAVTAHGALTVTGKSTQTGGFDSHTTSFMKAGVWLGLENVAGNDAIYLKNTGATGLSVLDIGGGFTIAETSGNTAISGTLTVTGLTTATGGVSLGEALIFASNGTGGAGRIFGNATTGLTIRGKTGTSHDWYLTRPDGTAILANPTGTTSLIAYGAVTASSTLTATGQITATGGIVVANNNNINIGTTSGNTGRLQIYDSGGTAYTLGVFSSGTRTWKFEGSSSGSDHSIILDNPGAGAFNFTVNGLISSNPGTGQGQLNIKRYADTNSHTISGGSASETTSLTYGSSGATSQHLWLRNGTEAMRLNGTGVLSVVGAATVGSTLDVTGDVSIGTATKNGALTVDGDRTYLQRNSDGAISEVLALRNSGTTAGTLAKLSLLGSDSIPYASFRAGRAASSNSHGRLLVYTRNTSVEQLALEIDENQALTVYGDVYPSADRTHDLGADGNEFENAWISGKIYHINTSNYRDYKTWMINTTSEVFIQNDAGGDFTITTPGGGAINMTAAGGAGDLVFSGYPTFNRSVLVSSSTTTGLRSDTGVTLDDRRTNYLPVSIPNATDWGVSGTLTSAFSTAPDGNATGVKWAFTPVGNSTHILSDTGLASPNYASGTKVVCSFWQRNATVSTGRIRLNTTAGSLQALTTYTTNQTSTWQRISVVCTTTVASQDVGQFRFEQQSDHGDGEFEVWGVQVETDVSFASTYMPTTGSSRVRPALYADSAEIRSSVDASLTLNRRGAWASASSMIRWDANDMGATEWEMGMKADSTNDLYLLNSGGGTIFKVVDGSTDFTFGSNVSLAATKKLYLDGGGDTYIHEAGADNLQVVVGGGTKWAWTGSMSTSYQAMTVSSGDPYINLTDTTLNRTTTIQNVDGTLHIGAHSASSAITIAGFTGDVTIANDLAVTGATTLSSTLAITASGASISVDDTNQMTGDQEADLLVLKHTVTAVTASEATGNQFDSLKPHAGLTFERSWGPSTVSTAGKIHAYGEQGYGAGMIFMVKPDDGNSAGAVTEVLDLTPDLVARFFGAVTVASTLTVTGTTTLTGAAYANGAFTLGGGNMYFTGTGTETKTAQLVQTNDQLYINAYGVANLFRLDLNTGAYNFYGGSLSTTGVVYANNTSTTSSGVGRSYVRTTLASSYADTSYRNDGDPTLITGIYGSTAAGTVLGKASANLAYMMTTTYATGQPSGLAIGTWSNQDVVLGTNNTAALTINGTTQAATFAGEITGGKINLHAADADDPTLTLYTSTTTGIVRQYFRNSDSSKSFEFDAMFDTNRFYLQSQVKTIARWDYTTGVQTVYANIEPNATNLYDLGTAALRWRDIYGVDADLSGTLTVTGLANASRFTPTGVTVGEEVTFGVYASGAWVNTPTATNGWLGVGGSGVLKYYGTGVDITGVLNVSGNYLTSGYHYATYTGEQLRLRWDVTNYTGFTVDSGGDLLIDPSGGGITLDGTVAINSTLTVSGTGTTLTDNLYVSGNAAAYMRIYTDANADGTAEGALIFNEASVNHWRVAKTASSQNLEFHNYVNNVSAVMIVPNGQLDHQGTADTTLGDARYTIQTKDNTAMAAAVGGGISFAGNYTAAGAIADFAAIWGEKENATEANYAGALHLGTRVHGGTISSDLVISSAGNVGINQSSPVSELQVTGTTTMSAVTGSYNTPYTALQAGGYNYVHTSWPGIYVQAMYDASYVDNFLGMGAKLTAGTRSSPTFSTHVSQDGFAWHWGGTTAGLFLKHVAANATDAAPTNLAFFDSGTVTFYPDVTISGSSPKLVFTDTDHQDWHIEVDSNNFHIHNINNGLDAFQINAGGTCIWRSGAGATMEHSSTVGLTLYNATAPTTSATAGIRLYSEDVSASAELKVRDEAGNITTLSPHNFSLLNAEHEAMAWGYYSERDGSKVNTDMLRVIRKVEDLTGEKLVEGEGELWEDREPLNIIEALVSRIEALEAQLAG